MKAVAALVCLVGLCAPAISQNPAAPEASKPVGYANYSIMLVNPSGGAVVLMHNPKNALEFVDVAKTKQAFAAGYAPVRAAELADFIGTLREENARLSAENAKLQGAQTVSVDSGLNETNCHTYQWLKGANVDQLKTCAALYPATVPELTASVPSVPAAGAAPPAGPSVAEIAEQQREQEQTQKAARRQQLIQTWMMIQAMRPTPQPYRIQPAPMLPAASPSTRLQTNCATQNYGSSSYTTCN